MTADRSRFLDAAERIGRRLCRDAVWAEGRCSWLGWAMEPLAGQWVNAFRAMGANVYDGTAGIGVFLAHLYRLTGDPIVRMTAEGALAQSLAAVHEMSVTGDYGFYTGLSGIAWVCTEVARLLDNDRLAEHGEAATLAAARLPPSPQRLDLINGSAGLIPFLLETAIAARSDELLEAAVRHGEHLLRLAQRRSQGWSWDTLGVPGEPHLLGLAHGTSGIAYGLAALAEATGQHHFAEGAREALRYERCHFRSSAGNWPDLRSFAQPQNGEDGEPPCMIAWCHGAPGISIARLHLHRLWPETPEMLAEAEIGIRTTAATLVPSSTLGLGNFSLCHGDAGNADVLVIAGDLIARSDLREQADAVGRRGIQRFEDQDAPWPCGVLGAGETPGLMLGLAGIGYFLLRLYDSTVAPTMLLPGSRLVSARRPHVS